MCLQQVGNCSDGRRMLELRDYVDFPLLIQHHLLVWMLLKNLPIVIYAVFCIHSSNKKKLDTTASEISLIYELLNTKQIHRRVSPYSLTHIISILFNKLFSAFFV